LFPHNFCEEAAVFRFLAEMIALVGCFVVLPVVLYLWAIILGIQP